MADQKYSDKCPTAWLPVATIAGHPNHISTQPGRSVPGRGPVYDHGPLGDERVIQRHHLRRGLSYGSGTASGYPAEGELSSPITLLINFKAFPVLFLAL